LRDVDGVGRRARLVMIGAVGMRPAVWIVTLLLAGVGAVTGLVLGVAVLLLLPVDGIVSAIVLGCRGLRRCDRCPLLVRGTRDRP
jgi:hypothetical protein